MLQRTLGYMCLFHLWFPQGYMPSSGIAGSHGRFISSFLRNFHTILHSDHVNWHSHQQYKRVPIYPHPLQHLLFVDFFDDGHSDQWEVISHRSFDLHFSNNERLYAFFSCVCWPTVCLLWINVCLGLLPTSWLGCFFGTELHELLVYFENQSSVSCVICYCFLPFWGLLFHLAYSFLCCAKASKFNQVSLVYFCFYFHYSRR